MRSARLILAAAVALFRKNSRSGPEVVAVGLFRQNHSPGLASLVACFDKIKHAAFIEAVTTVPIRFGYLRSDH